MYDTGSVLRYGAGRAEDQFGGLGQTSLCDSDDDWSPFEIARDEFERVWNSDRENQPR